MRTITNDHRLPQTMYQALAADTYIGGGDISATRIIAPIRTVALRRYHEDEIVEDASSRIWSLLGSSVHRMLELAKGDHEHLIVEKRIGMDFKGIDLPGEGPMIWRVTAQPDLYDSKKRELTDFKVTSVWSALATKTEWDKQLNIQAMLHRNQGDEVDHLNIVTVLRDWQHRKAKMEKNYPGAAVMKLSIPLWEQQEAIDYVTGRIKLHQKAQIDYENSDFDISALPLCTEEERWYRGHAFAVKKQDTKGNVNKKADRLFDNKTDALQYMSDNALKLPKGKQWAPIEERPGENIRCADYCDVADICDFGRKVKAEIAAKAAAAHAQPEEKPEED